MEIVIEVHHRWNYLHVCPTIKVNEVTRMSMSMESGSNSEGNLHDWEVTTFTKKCGMSSPENCLHFQKETWWEKVCSSCKQAVRVLAAKFDRCLFCSWKTTIRLSTYICVITDCNLLQDPNFCAVESTQLYDVGCGTC